MARSPRHPLEVRRFQRAAVHRLVEAHYLLKQGANFTTAAVYLAGYAVECSLKALLLSTVPVAQHSDVLGSFRGAKAHDFEWLRHELTRRGVSLPQELRESLARVSWWATDLRYEPRTVPLKVARAFLDATERILQWVNGRL